MCRREFFDPWPPVGRAKVATQQANRPPLRIMGENARMVNLVRYVKRAGYMIGPYLGYLQTVEARDIAIRHYAAYYLKTAQGETTVRADRTYASNSRLRTT